jgi:hypothetical protein
MIFIHKLNKNKEKFFFCFVAEPCNLSYRYLTGCVERTHAPQFRQHLGGMSPGGGFREKGTHFILYEFMKI